MRETLTTLTQQTIDLITDPSTTASQLGISDTSTYVKKHLNQLVRDIQARLNNYLTQKIATALTVASQQYYYLPVDCHTIDAMTVSVSGRNWPIAPVELDRWLQANRTVFASTQFPTYYLRREKDFGIWPTPGSSGNTITLYYNRILKDLTASDYTTGTITATNNSATITGSGTTWTAAMVGRYLKVDSDGAWYRILTFNSVTELLLETVYAGTTSASETYTIGESPEVPEQMHGFLPYGVAAAYYGGVRRDQATAQTMLNYYYTGDYNNSERDIQKCRSGIEYWVNYYNGKGRDVTGLTDRSTLNTMFFNDQFTVVTM